MNRDNTSLVVIAVLGVGIIKLFSVGRAGDIAESHIHSKATAGGLRVQGYTGWHREVKASLDPV